MKNSQLFIRLTLLSVILPLFLSSCIKIQGQQEEYKPQTIDGYDYTPLLQVEIPDDVKSQLKNYSGYTVSFNADNGTANWVAWALTPERVDGPISRKGKKFWTDEEITSCPDTRSYTNSGFDRGHLCPAADNKINEEMMNDCFSLANIVPQDHALNAGAWKTLESKEREWVMRDGLIIVVAGPIYTSSDRQRIGDDKVRVPSAFFKVMLAPTLSTPRAIAFIYPNMTSPGNMANYSMSVDEVEEILGYDFFVALSDEIENAIESKGEFKLWNKR